METRKDVISEYLLFMINRKEKTGMGYKNQSAKDHYIFIRQTADMYGCSVMDVVYATAMFVMRGEFISLLGKGI